MCVSTHKRTYIYVCVCVELQLLQVLCHTQYVSYRYVQVYEEVGVVLKKYTKYYVSLYVLYTCMYVYMYVYLQTLK